MSTDKITIKADITAKKSPNLRQVVHKANAGLSEAEAIERHTIGEYHGSGTEEEGKQEEG